MSNNIVISVDELESKSKRQPKTQNKPDSKCSNNYTHTIPLYCTSKYGNFCVEKVLDAHQVVSDHDRNAQCCDCMAGFICFPFLPVMCIYDVITYPIRRLTKCFDSK